MAETKLIAENRRARRDYEFLERVEAGVVADRDRGEVRPRGTGPARAGLRATSATARRGSSAPRSPSTRQAGAFGHEPDRDRKLLLHRREIDSLYGKVREKGLTLVPTRMYFKDGRVKVELALARGRERADKRRVIAERDAQRQIERALKRRR